MGIKYGPLLETAKQTVEQIVSRKKAKCLLSDCFIHMYHIILLLSRDEVLIECSYT